jgi:acetyl esterase
VSRALLARALLTAVGLVVLAPVVAITMGGFAPTLALVGGFGSLIAYDLPWIGIGAVVAAILCSLPLALGGRWFHRGVAGVALLTLAGVILITARVLVFAGSVGAPISFTRALSPDAPSAAKPDRTATFATIGTDALAAEIWSSPAGAPNRGPAGRTAVVYVHGGAFTGGMLRSRPTLFSFLAGHGFPVVDVEYRLAPPPRWNQAAPDVLCALAWVAANASDLGIDPTRVVVMGDSAGGNLALMAGYAAGTNQLTSSCGGAPPRPAAVVAIAPAADLVGIWADDTLSAAGVRFPEAYIGGPPPEFPDRYRVASPFSLIQPGLPPTLVITGDIDHLVRLGRVTELTYRLHFAGDDCTLVVVPYADHGFDGAANGYGAQIEESILPKFIEAHTGGAAWAGPACPATTVEP